MATKPKTTRSPFRKQEEATWQLLGGFTGVGQALPGGGEVGGFHVAALREEGRTTDGVAHVQHALLVVADRHLPPQTAALTLTRRGECLWAVSLNA